MIKFTCLLSLLMEIRCFSAGPYCLFNDTPDSIRLTISSNGYNLRRLDVNPLGGTTYGKTLKDQSCLVIHSGDEVILETTRNYCNKKTEVSEIAMGGKDPIKLRISLIKNKPFGQFLLSQDYSIDSFYNPRTTEEGKKNLKKYASRVCSLILLQETPPIQQEKKEENSAFSCFFPSRD